MLEGDKMREKMRNFWQGIYQMHLNRIEEKWTEEIRRRYEEELEIRRRREVGEQERLMLPKIMMNPYSR